MDKRAEFCRKNFSTHGLSGTRIYGVYKGIKRRCFNENDPSYKNYGGRGITICEEWLNDFRVFYDWCLTNGYSKGLDIDREDNDGDYTPDNCRFVTRKVNGRNTRWVKLKVNDVLEIRNAYNLGCFTFAEIAKAYNISITHAWDIINQKVWVI